MADVHSVWLQLLFRVHLLHGDLQPDVLLLPWQELGLLLLLLPPCLVLEEGFHGEFALVRRHMVVNKLLHTHPRSPLPFDKRKSEEV